MRAWDVWATFVLCILLVLVWLVYQEVRDIELQLEHIDSHFQAPEPTPQSEG
jgi:hypothetical protein